VKDSFGREINYLRISVTDRCNFDCLYCSHPVEMLPRERVLRFEDIVVLVQAAKELGIKKVRLTGGEPLLRRDIDKLVAMLHELDVTVHTTTNGLMLARLAEPLKEAGLDGLNVSLDFVDAEKFRQITGGGDLATVVQGIDKALEVGLPVKLNAVFTAMHETKDLKELLNFGKERNLPIRFIELMPKNLGSFSSLFRPIGDAQSMIESFTQLRPVGTNAVSGGPAEYYLTDDGVEVGFIGFFSLNQCKQCNRIRVTSSGAIYPCLLRNVKVEAFESIKQGKEATKEALLKAVSIKPVAGNPEEVGPDMSEIGG